MDIQFEHSLSEAIIITTIIIVAAKLYGVITLPWQICLMPPIIGTTTAIIMMIVLLISVKLTNGINFEL